ncbi:MAG: DUF2255 family protein [Thermomicrobiales bacterium]
MTSSHPWTAAQLATIAAADELTIASRRKDGSLRDPVIVWVVRHDNDLFVRAVRGRTSPWFRGVQSRHEGHIRAGGVQQDVTFEEASDEDLDALDAAYRRKYGRYAKSIVDSTVTPDARAATLRLVPAGD